MIPVLPTHFSGPRSGFSSNGSMSNVMLREGEVQAIYYPGDDGNVSGKFVEYDVWAAHRANGTAVTKLYSHVIAIDHFGSVADFSFSTYRVKKTATNESGEKELAPGLGSKVILLCINGETNNAVILGGIRDFHSDPDSKEDGHHHHTRFNGIDVQVNKDGELIVTYNGATQLDGTPDPSTDTKSSGTFVKIDKQGNFTVSDVDGSNMVFVDHVNGKVQVKSKSEVDVVSPTVRLGDDQTTDPSVLGNELKGVLNDLITAISAITVPTAVGPSGTPINVTQFQQIAAKLDSILSGTVFVK